MLITLLFACSDPALKLTGNVDDGATVFADNCAECHGDDGHGGSNGSVNGPDLADETPEYSDAEIVDIIRDGKEDMPAQPQLSDQDIADVIAWIRDQFGGGEG